jgi:Protein of unknown function (DUF1360)
MILLEVLAAYRLTRLVVEDGLTAPVREWVWRRFPVESSRLGYVLSCPHCTGVWVAGLVVGVNVLVPGRAAAVGTRVLAVAGAVSLVNDVRAVWELGVESD